MAVALSRRSFTVDEYHKMAEAGILGEDDRVELIEGEIVTMTPIGSRHAACINRLTHLLSAALETRAIVSVQNPLRLSDRTEPQPDVALLRPRADFYAEAHPTPAEVLLLIEVADTSLVYDRDVKLPLYARAGIPECWLIDLAQRQVLVCREPGPEGYETVITKRPGDSLVAALADLDLAIDDLLV